MVFFIWCSTVMTLIYCKTIITDFGISSISIICCFYFSRLAYKPFIGFFLRYPISAISTSSAFSYISCFSD